MRSSRRTHLEADPAAVWATLGQVTRYQTWWPWLRAFDAEGLTPGDRWACTVQPPVPYTVRFTIALDEVVAPASVSATVQGDVAGTARIDLRPHGTGTELALEADLHADAAWLRQVERWAPPVARFGHDRIIDRALASLAATVAESAADEDPSGS